MSEAFVKVTDVVKKYTIGEHEIFANDNMNFGINKGEFVVILGQSGAGKTTLLNILGGMDQITSGDVIIDELNIAKLKEKELTMFRRHHVGFIFQFYNLIPNLTARENVEIALEITKDPLDITDTLKAVGLEDRMDNFPAQLSGGEQQRVAIARALAKNPKILLCDEPTGALDYETGKKILKVLHDTSRLQNQTVIVVTHNQALKAMADRVITIKNGQVETIKVNKNPVDIELIEW